MLQITPNDSMFVRDPRHTAVFGAEHGWDAAKIGRSAGDEFKIVRDSLALHWRQAVVQQGDVPGSCTKYEGDSLLCIACCCS